MKRVAAGAHLPTPWFFEPAKRPDDTAGWTRAMGLPTPIQKRNGTKEVENHGCRPIVKPHTHTRDFAAELNCIHVKNRKHVGFVQCTR